MTLIRGPMNFSTNDEVGFLLEGFDSPPAFMMSYNPKYYLDFMERYGMAKAKDLYAYYIDKNNRTPGSSRARKNLYHLKTLLSNRLENRPRD